MTKSELKSIIFECLEENGIIEESVSFKKTTSGKYTYYVSNKKINGCSIKVDDTDYDKLDSKTFEKCYNAAKKNYNKCLEQAAKDMFKRARSIGIDRFKSEEDLKKALKVIDILYVESKNKNEYLADFHISFDTNPYLDPNHMYTLYVTINNDLSVSCDDYSYDG